MKGARGRARYDKTNQRVAEEGCPLAVHDLTPTNCNLVNDPLYIKAHAYQRGEGKTRHEDQRGMGTMTNKGLDIEECAHKNCAGVICQGGGIRDIEQFCTELQPGLAEQCGVFYQCEIQVTICGTADRIP